MAEAIKAGDPRDGIIDALMRLAALHDWDAISLSDIAQEAGMDLGTMRAAFPSKGAILGAYSRRIDLAVLKDDGADMADETARERLFDVLMRRIDAMAPHKAALKRIAKAVRRDPLTMAALNSAALNSQRYMLAAAGISAEDALGPIKAQGAVLAFAATLETWFEDEDPGMARTLARLDKELRRGETFIKRADDVYRLTAPLRAFCTSLSERRPRSRERAAREAPIAEPGDDYAPVI